MMILINLNASNIQVWKWGLLDCVQYIISGDNNFNYDAKGRLLIHRASSYKLNIIKQQKFLFQL